MGNAQKPTFARLYMYTCFVRVSLEPYYKKTFGTVPYKIASKLVLLYLKTHNGK